MNTIMKLAIAATMALCVTNAGAETPVSSDNMDAGFYALDHVMGKSAQQASAMNNDELDQVVGGWTPLPDPPIWGPIPWPFPWPDPNPCWSCPLPYKGIDKVTIDPVIFPGELTYPGGTKVYF